MDPVPRTCTEISQTQKTENINNAPLPLRKLRTVPAYVLLGDPGSGKSTEFETECNDLGDEAVLISAREFLTFDVANHPEWQERTIFIDGLDEVRTGDIDSRTPFDIIRNKLDNIGRPFFRISCRETDWLGENDRKNLEAISPNFQVKMLRLDPLTESNIDSILKAILTIDKAEDFKKEAYRRNLNGLLVNPLSLRLLTEIITKEGNWPASRLETFESACKLLAVERNEEHCISEPIGPTKILDAAGRLCAIQLISGAVGHSLDFNRVYSGYISPDTWGCESSDVRRRALSSKLFTTVPNSVRLLAPVHRHIAEFLAAQHLAQLINDGLPSSRVLSLIIGEDGGVVSEFRGLSAWLAAYSSQARVSLIEIDPIGVGLYGDIRDFTPNEKHRLLKSLNHKIDRFENPKWQIAEAFAPLVSPEMESTLLDIISGTNRDDHHEDYISFLLEILQRGMSLPGISQTCIDIVYDSSNPGIASSALQAFIHNSITDITDQLIQLLKDIQIDNPSDPNYYLSDILLRYLYPQNILPSEIWNYIDNANNRCYDLRYSTFWNYDLFDKSSDDSIAELLDQLYGILPNLKEKLIVAHLKTLPLRLLTCGLYLHEDKLATSRLYKWLKVGLLRDRWPYHFYARHIVNEDPTYDIRTWLESHPQTQKNIILEKLIHCSEKGDDLHEHLGKVLYYLYDSKLPSDLGLWSLEKSIELSNRYPQVSEQLLRISVDLYSQQIYDQGLSRSLLFDRTRGYPILKEKLLVLLDQYDNRQQEDDNAARQHDEARWISYLRSNISSLHNNTTNLKLLNDIGKIYYGLFPGQDYSMPPLERIKEALNYEDYLVEAALSALIDVLWREDIPDVDEIINLELEKKTHLLMYPFLAGLDEIVRTRSTDFSQLTYSQIHKAIAFYYTTQGDVGKDGYSELVKVHPEPVKNILLKYSKSKFSSSKSDTCLSNLEDSGLYNLAFESSHALIAKQVSLPLLQCFPIRCTQGQIRALDYLLWSALQYADDSSLCELIRHKLSYKSMNIFQKIHLLAAGLIVRPDEFSTPLEAFVKGKDKRLRYLAAFFAAPHSPPVLTDRHRSTELELLIKLLGPSFNPSCDFILSDGFFSKPSDQVSDFIGRLATLPNQAANQALNQLIADPVLFHWHEELTQALDSQRVLYRDAIYRYPDVEQIHRTLNNQAPANVADLVALVIDHLNQIADRIHTNNTDDWRQYWNEDSNGQPKTPKNENSCRDALLSDLQERLPAGVDAQPEGQYANDSRADIRVFYSSFNVPIEVKKNGHRDLWSAQRDQLIKQYTNDPKTGGYGIYLVFWFGERYTQPPPQGKGPANSEEMRVRLQSTLTEEESRKITVCVVDVEKP